MQVFLHNHFHFYSKCFIKSVVTHFFPQQDDCFVSFFPFYADQRNSMSFLLAFSTDKCLLYNVKWVLEYNSLQWFLPFFLRLLLMKTFP